MNIKSSMLKREEKAIFELRDLYRKYGYVPYKMSKFEEYELYVRNKDFLVSDHIISFTDTNGRLMALKPDVTLSIIKNGRDEAGTVQKVYYDENVYRASRGSHQYKEITQVGLECIGDVDTYHITEVLMLAADSLRGICCDCVLDVSHLDIVSSLMDLLCIDGDTKDAIIKCIGEKNTDEMIKIADSCGLSHDAIEPLLLLVNAYGDAKTVLPQLSGICRDGASRAALAELWEITNTLTEMGYSDILRIDFSVTSNMNYYNGVVFRGFVNGIPTGILSGGQYDKLMQKMGRKSRAVGFAVYLDLLGALSDETPQYDVDCVLLYTDEDDMAQLSLAVRTLTEDGLSVTAQKRVPDKLRYRQLLRLTEKGVEKL